MSELRWILIAFGIILLAGIYVWGRRGNKQSARSEDALVRARPEPHLPSHDAESHAFEPQHAAASASDESGEYSDELMAPAAVNQHSITALRQVPRDESGFATPAASRAADFSREAGSTRRGRVEPTLKDAGPGSDEFSDDDNGLTEELPAREPPAAGVAAPTLAMSDTPQPRRIERRKIIALRLAAASDRYAGQQLRETLEAESLQYGKYDVFHCLHEDGTSIFSVASMVEPGTFDLEHMAAQRYPGVTLFAQLPGPVAGAQALHELVACGKRLQQSLGGTLQDERGVPLTVHRIERLRQEIQDFERAPGRDVARDNAQRHPLSPPSR